MNHRTRAIRPAGITTPRWGAVGLAIAAAAVMAMAWPTPSQAACGVTDGTSSGAQLGTRVGSNPVRFKFADSPYMGVRFDSCANVLRAYYGGWTGNTHYNLRYDGGGPYIAPPAKQIQLAPGPARVWTLSAAP